MSRRKRSNDHTRSPEVLTALERRELELDPAIDAWMQQPGEKPRNYGMFLMYRDLGRARTVAQIGELSPLSFAGTARIARFNKWVARAGLWDAEQDRLLAIRLQSDREDMARRHSAAARKLMEKAIARLATLDVNSISPHALVLMLDTAARIERAALGLETLNKGAQSTQTSVTVAASTKTDAAGKPEVRVEVGVQHDRIMATLDQMVSRMSPEQIEAGYEELTASAKEATRELDAALPAPPPQ
ncbi:MAG: hypothetical protein ABW026_10040 [Microvirga sp.]